MNAQSPSTELGEYWAILRRRKWRFVVPLLGTLGLGIAAAYLFPPVYRAEATVLIERQTIPSDLVESTVTGYVQEQIEQIRRRIVARDNLLHIAEKYDLYPEERARDPNVVVRELAGDLEVEMVDVEESGATRRGERTATIAFIVAFKAPSPETAQAVTEDLTRRYLEEHKSARSKQAAAVTRFLTEEADRLREEIATLEEKLARFKQEQLHQLPQMMEMNQKLYESTEEKIDATTRRIRSLQDQIESLQAEVSVTSPYKEVITEQGERVLTGGERLSMLMADYFRDSARYSARHPDIIRLRREIETLTRRSGNAEEAGLLLGELTRLQSELRTAREKYSEAHPDVQKLESEIASVESALRNAAGAADTGNWGELAAPDNPRYVTLKTQIATMRSNLREEEERREELRNKLEKYQDRLSRTPAVERDYQALTRDHDNAVRKYNEIRDKLLQARLAEKLESENQGQRFVLSQAPLLPTSPYSPNRMGIMLLAAVLGFGGGLGSLAVAEYTDRSVRGREGVAAVFGAPPLAVVPHISTKAEKVRRTDRRIAGATAALGMSVLVAVAYLYLRPLPEPASGKLQSAEASGASNGARDQGPTAQRVRNRVEN